MTFFKVYKTVKTKNKIFSGCVGTIIKFPVTRKIKLLGVKNKKTIIKKNG
jgi:hypothetical protein